VPAPLPQPQAQAQTQRDPRGSGPAFLALGPLRPFSPSPSLSLSLSLPLSPSLSLPAFWEPAPGCPLALPGAFFLPPLALPLSRSFFLPPPALPLSRSLALALALAVAVGHTAEAAEAEDEVRLGGPALGFGPLPSPCSTFLSMAGRRTTCEAAAYEGAATPARP